MLHKYDEPALEVNVTLSPAQKVVDRFADMVAVGSGSTETFCGDDVDVHPPASLTVTE